MANFIREFSRISRSIPEGLLELIVVGGSPELANLNNEVEDGNVTYIPFVNKRQYYAALNAGIRSIKNNTAILLAEANATLELNSLLSIIEAFNSGTWLAWGSYTRPSPRATCQQRQTKTASHPYTPWALSTGNCIPRGALGFRKSLYIDTGGFDTSLKDDDSTALLQLAIKMEQRLRGIRINTINSVLARIDNFRPPNPQAVAKIFSRHNKCKLSALSKTLDDDTSLPPDFSHVKLSYSWMGKQGNTEILKRRNNIIKTPIKCSVVIPMYKSARVIEKCLTSLLKTTSQDTEIIVVADGEPDNAFELAESILKDIPRALLLKLSENTGFAHAVNTEGTFARGKYLLPLNADTIMHSPNWLAPMEKILDERTDVAIVGNKHIDIEGNIDSAGSEFSWDTNTFRHIGRDTPEPTKGTGDKERDMLTFACVLIRASVWRELNGLDERYRRAYFEDSDFCMRTRERGYKIIYTPHSVITHIGRHAHAGGGFEYRANAELFKERWIKTGAVARFAKMRGVSLNPGRIIVCMIACSEEEFIASSIESVYAVADKIIIVEGGTTAAFEAGLCDAKGRSSDNTIAEIQSVNDIDQKIKVIRAPERPWRDKNEMRNAYATFLKDTDYMLLLDGDEVFSEDGLWRMLYLMSKNDVVRPLFHLFWNNLDTLGTGRWDQYAQVKFVRWRDGLSYSNDHNMPCDHRGVPVTDLADVRVLHTRERLYYHYSWAGKTDSKLRAKCKFYSLQNGEDVFNPNYFEQVMRPWRTSREYIEQNFGTHPYGSGGTETALLSHPEPVKRRIETGRIFPNHHDSNKQGEKQLNEISILERGKDGYSAGAEFFERTERAVREVGRDKRQFHRDALEVASFIRDDYPALTKILSELKSYSLLDLGCGYGRLAPLLTAFDCADYLGVETLEPRLAHARRRYSSAICRFLLADALHFRSYEKFDVVFSSNVLQHLVLPEKLLLLSSMKAAVKDNGTVILREAEIIKGTSQMAEIRYRDPAHPWHMIPITHDQLKTALKPFEIFAENGIIYAAKKP